MRISPELSQLILNALNSSDQAEQTALQQLTTGRRVNADSDVQNLLLNSFHLLRDSVAVRLRQGPVGSFNA